MAARRASTAFRRRSSASARPRQAKLLKRLLDGFEGKLTSSKWATIAKCSPDTALRDITELLARGVLQKSAAAGRSTSYELNGALMQGRLAEPSARGRTPS